MFEITRRPTRGRPFFDEYQKYVVVVEHFESTWFGAVVVNSGCPSDDPIPSDVPMGR